MPLLLVLLWATGGSSFGDSSNDPCRDTKPLPPALAVHCGRTRSPSLAAGDAAQGLWADAVEQSGRGGLRVGKRRGGPCGWGACVCGGAQPGPPGHRPDRRPPREPVPYHLCPVQEFQESLMPVVMK